MWIKRLRRSGRAAAARASSGSPAVALIVLMMVTVLDVFLRYVFNRPIRGSYDIVEVHAADLRVQRHGGGLLRPPQHHHRPDRFVRRGPRVDRVLIRIADVLSVVVLMLALLGDDRCRRCRSYQYGDVKLELQIADLLALDRGAASALAGTIFCAPSVVLFARPAPAETGHTE